MTASTAPPPGARTFERLRLGIHVALGVLAVTLGVWAGLQWSLISVSVDSVIVDTAWAEEGPAFKLLILDDDRTLTIDDGLMDRLGGPEAVTDQRLRTSTWSTTAQLGDRRVGLRWSSTATLTVATLVVLSALGLLRTWRARRR